MTLILCVTFQGHTHKICVCADEREPGNEAIFARAAHALKLVSLLATLCTAAILPGAW